MNMAFSTLNDQVVDTVASTDALMLGLAPAVAMGNLYVATSHALATAAHNATNAQQAMDQIAQAVTKKCVELLRSLPPKS
jgi:ABC-type nickel/cobalt efflux system permease component RcnA